MRPLLVLLLIFSVNAAGAEQQIDLEIQVVSKQTARQLGRVKVKIKGPVTAGQLTDADGKVKFQNLPAGQYDVRVRGRGYRARQKNFQVG